MVIFFDVETHQFVETHGRSTISTPPVSGCENLDTDSVARSVAELPMLRSLRLGFECQEALWALGAKIPMMALTLSWNFAAMNLRFLELDLGLAHQQERNATDQEVKALLSLKALDVLLLWNLGKLQQQTFRALVSFFQSQVDAFTLEDCYHSEESYFHVLPTTWKVYNRDTLDAFAAEGLLPDTGCPTQGPSGRRILTALNVARDPDAQKAAMVTPVMEVCQVQDVMLVDEFHDSSLARLASENVRSVEIRFTPNTPNSYFQETLVPFLKACPELRTLRIDLRQHFYARHLTDYDLLLNELAETCSRLEELEFLVSPPDEWGEQARSHALVEYYSGPGPQTKLVVTAKMGTVEKLLQNCRGLQRIRLLPPSVESRVGYWRLIRSMGHEVEHLDLIESSHPAKMQAELDELPQVIELVAARNVSLNFGMVISPTIADSLLSVGLRSFRAEQVPSVNDPFWELLRRLPAHSPHLEELALGRLSVPSGEELQVLETLRGFHHLKELRLNQLLMDSKEPSIKALLPQVVQQNRRTLKKLYVKGFGLDVKTLLSAISLCRHLEVLEIHESREVKEDQLSRVFSGTRQDLAFKVAVRCPRLTKLEIQLPIAKPAGENTDILRSTLQICRHLGEMGDVNVSFYRGLQYNGGMEEPERSEDSDSSDD